MLIQMLLGVLIGFIIKARTYIIDNTFDVKIWWIENRYRLLWSTLLSLGITAAHSYAPEAVESILTGLGADLDFNNPAIPILSGLAILNIAYKPLIKE